QRGPAIGLVTNNVTPGLAANHDTVEAAEGEPTVIDVLANDGAQPGAVLTIDSVTQPAHGTAVIDGATIIYTPEAEFLGVDTFQYTVSSDQGGEATATVNVLVSAAGVNLPPIANPDTASTTTGQPVGIAVMDNDLDPDGDTFTISAGDSAIPGILTYSPVLYWACLPSGGASTLFDQSGNGRDGLVSIGVEAGPERDDCGGGTSMVFPDGSAVVSRDNPGLPMGAAPRSIMVRYRSDVAGPADVGLFGHGMNAIGLAQFSIARTSGGNDRLVFSSWSNDGTVFLPPGANIADGAEHTIVIVYDGATTLTAYVDGVPGAPATLFIPLNTVDDTVMLGQTLYGAVSAGAEMRHFAIFDVALDGAAVSALHAAIETVGGGAAFTQPANG
ncbi:MAG: Ig-like domain-containing protein, partial [Dehalococcoidia bacterium]